MRSEKNFNFKSRLSLSGFNADLIAWVWSGFLIYFLIEPAIYVFDLDTKNKTTYQNHSIRRLCFIVVVESVVNTWLLVIGRYGLMGHPYRPFIVRA